MLRQVFLRVLAAPFGSRASARSPIYIYVYTVPMSNACATSVPTVDFSKVSCPLASYWEDERGYLWAGNPSETRNRDEQSYD